MSLFSTKPKDDYEFEYTEKEPKIQEAPMEKEELVMRPKPAMGAEKAGTFISKDMTLCGTIRGAGVISIEGTVEGEIQLDGTVIVERSGLVKGPVAAKVIQVAGRIEGNVTAVNHLRLEEKGCIHGDVETLSLVIADGGRLNGRTTMGEKAREKGADQHKEAPAAQKNVYADQVTPPQTAAAPAEQKNSGKKN